MSYFKNDLLKVPKFILGISIMAIGIMLTRKAGLGMTSWGVFHEGLTQSTGLSFGFITMSVGAILLVFTKIFLKVEIGLGTILNIAIAGVIIDLSQLAFEQLFPSYPTTLAQQIILMHIGVLLMTFGRALYISCRLGPGPRDGMFTGLARKYNIPVKYTKIGIELTVLIVGLILGGAVSSTVPGISIFGVRMGYGTPYLTFISGYLVQYFFKLLKHDNSDKKQSNIIHYFIKYEN